MNGLSPQRVSRREWLRTSGAAIALAAIPAAAQSQQEVARAAECMRPLTGTELPAGIAPEVAGLVSVIGGYSVPLRQLDLGGIEPATVFEPTVLRPTR